MFYGTILVLEKFFFDTFAKRLRKCAC